MTTLGFYQKLAGQKRVTTRTAAQLTGVSIPAASMALRRLAAEGLARAEGEAPVAASARMREILRDTAATPRWPRMVGSVCQPGTTHRAAPKDGALR